MLCAKTVKEVLPDLIENKDKLERMVAGVNEQIAKKGVELNKFIELHNIKVRGQEVLSEKGEVAAADDDDGPGNSCLVTTN